ncbi:MAG: hypothetical protein JWL83_1902 [Actinomycetia bacterium]|nr:hypothetical protein [Actinomycetes bacterium]
MRTKRTLAIGATAVVSVAGLGAGVAAAAGGGHAKQVRHAVVRHAVKTATPTTEATGPDTDTLQQGDQTTPDAPSAAKATTVKAAETTSETAGETAGESTTPEAPGDANLPGGGHTDPAGSNVDHQFDGTE